MRYAEYKNKMLKWKKARKILIIASIPVSLTIVGLSTTALVMTSIKGNIEEVGKIEATYVYGKGFLPSARAINSNVEFEYSEKDKEEWTSEQPTLVGQYKFRAKAMGSNGYKYSDVQTFEITPVEVTAYVSDETVNYGNDHPSIKVDGLVNGDTYHKDYQITYSSLCEKDVKVNIVPESFHIFNNESVEVTNCYAVTFVEKDISFVPQKLSISFKDKNKRYDGEPLTADEYDITAGSLKYEDRIEVSGGKTITEIETVDENDHSIKIVNKDGEDVTVNYDITLTDSKMRIDKIPLSISSKTLSKIYDGKPFSEDDFVLSYDESKLISGHTLTYFFPQENKDLFKPTSEAKTNEFIYEIKCGEEDVSKYYDISLSVGTISINKRDLTITSSSKQFTFDGNEHNDGSYTITNGSLAEGDEIVINSYPSITATGSISNVLDFDLVNGTEDRKDCYNLNSYSGTIAINKVKINVKLIAEDSVTYDDQYHQIYDLSKVEITGVPEGFTPNISFVNVDSNNVKNYKAAGYSLTRNDFLFHLIKDSDGLDYVGNADLSYSFESMMINQRDVDITTGDYTKTYDGKKISYNDGEIGFAISGLVDGHTVKRATNTTSAENVGTGDIIATYKVFDASDNDVSSNYKMNVTNGRYEINTRNITLKAHSSVSKIYDCKNTFVVNSNNTYLEIIEGSFADADGYWDGVSIDSKSYTNTDTDVGVYDFEIDPSTVKITRNSVNKTTNYNITILNECQLTINPKTVNVVQTTERTYFDSKEHGINNRNDYTVSGLISGHSVTFSGGDFVDPGEYRYSSMTIDGFGNVFNPVVVDKDGVDKTHNYTFNYTSKFRTTDPITGEVNYPYTIIQKHITVSTFNIDKIFDGEPLDPDFKPFITYRYVFDNNETFYEGDKLVLEKVGDRPTHVADSTDPSKNKFNFTAKIVNSDGEDVTNLYVLDTTVGSLTINKCWVDVNLSQRSSVYNGASFGLSGSEISDLLSGDEFEITTETKDKYGVNLLGDPLDGYEVYGTFTDIPDGNYFAGDYFLTVDVQMYHIVDDERTGYNHDDIDIRLNRDPSVVKYSVLQKEITIETASADMPYTGKAAPEKRTVKGGLVSGDKLYFGEEEYKKSQSKYASVTDKIEIGEYENEVGEYRILRGSIDVTSCYKVNTVIGTIRIYDPKA